MRPLCWMTMKTMKKMIVMQNESDVHASRDRGLDYIYEHCMFLVYILMKYCSTDI